MSNEVFSNHIGGASELTVLASIKPDFVPSRLLISYAARLRVHLRTLGALRRRGLEGQRAGVYTGSLDALRTLQYISWTLIDDDTRMLLSVNFDRPLEPYLRRIVDVAGPLLDTILCHCEGFEGYSSDHGFHKFMEFANTHQAPVELFAASNPNLTVDDGDYLVQGDRDLRNLKHRPTTPPSVPVQPDATEQMLAELRLQRPEERLKENADSNKLALLDQGLNIVQTLFNNSHLFADDTSENRDDLLYYRLLERLTPGFWGSLYNGLPDEAKPNIADPFNLSSGELLLINGAIKALFEAFEDDILAVGENIVLLPERLQVLNLLNQHSDALDWYAKMPPPREREIEIPPRNYKTEVQNGLLSQTTSEPRTKPFDVGCLMLLRIDDADKARDFLASMEAELWFDGERDLLVNLSITHSGLKFLEIQDKIRREFPTAFREGMAARAGMLGDVDVNNPVEWVWPKSNWISKQSGAIEAGQNDPIQPETIDIIVQLVKSHNTEVSQFSGSHPLFIDVEAIAQKFGSGVSLIGVEPVLRKFVGENLQKVEGHFGFVDGISQPKFDEPLANQSGEYDVPNRHRDNATEKDRTLIGDLLLGHPSKADLHQFKHNSIRENAEEIKPYPEYQTPESDPTSPPDPDYKNTPLENGTFQVIRKLRTFTEAFGDLDQSVQEQMIGRKKTGEPLAGGGVGEQNFNYKTDENGKTTPLQCHIRRTNPREVETPRILRKGFSYGPFNDPAADRGVMFIAYNANIAEQFEVIQRWISGGNSTGISSYHGDPLLAPRRSDSTRTFRHFKNGKIEYAKLPSTPPAVLQWGLYAFTPSKTGLRWLSSVQTSNHVRPTPVTPTPRLKKFTSTASRNRWRLALEDYDEERRQERLDIWKEVRDLGGAADAEHYAYLVGSAEGVKQVLEDSDSFSVREYWDRMLESTGVIHLGMDPVPVATESTDPKDKDLDEKYRNGDGFHQPVKAGDYAARSAPVNSYFRSLSNVNLFNEAFNEANILLAELDDELRYLPKDEKDDPENLSNEGRHIAVTRFFYDLVARLCVKWLGMPSETAAELQVGGIEDETPHCPNDLVRASFYTFWPHPSDHTIKDSQARTPLLRNVVREYIKNGPSNHQGTLLGKMMAQNPNPTPQEQEEMADMVVGVSSGFAGPTGGSFRFVMFDWIKTGLLWRLQQQILNEGVGPTYGEMQPVLESSILASMAKRSAPDILHRETVKQTNIGGKTIEAGKRVVLGLRSATEDAVSKPGASKTDEQRFYLFGGDYNSSKPQPTHACPGQNMALCTMMAAFAAIMKHGEIRPESLASFRLR